MTETANKVSNPAANKGKVNKKALIIGGVSLLAAAGIGYGIYHFFFKDKGDEDYSDEDSGGAKKVSKTFTNRDYPLSYGTHHPGVGILQLYLKKTYHANMGNYGKNKDGIDGKFGKVTKEAALKHLKKAVFTEKDIAGMRAALKFIKV